METMPSIGGSTLMFSGAMLGASGTSWALRHGEPVPMIALLAPIVAALVTIAVLTGILRMRAKMGSPMPPAAARRQWATLFVFFIIGGIAGTWVGLRLDSFGG
jgi:divalent metal cation (Fe/Co/Zn/Cd) transporter